MTLNHQKKKKKNQLAKIGHVRRPAMKEKVLGFEIKGQRRERGALIKI